MLWWSRPTGVKREGVDVTQLEKLVNALSWRGVGGLHETDLFARGKR